VFTVTDDGRITLPKTAGTGRGATIRNASFIDNFPFVGAYPEDSTSNAAITLQVIPKGTGFNNGFIKAELAVFGTDLIVDPVNYEALAIKSMASGYAIDATRDGTGLARPIYFQMNNQTKMTLDTTGHLGIGTTNPATPLHVVETNSTNVTRGILSAQHNDGVHGAIVGFRKSRGTEASPTAVQQGDYIGGIDTNAFDGFNYQNPAAAAFVVDGPVSPDSTPTAFTVFTGYKIGVPGRAERMRVSSTGNVGIGTDSPTEKLDVNGNVKIETTGNGIIFPDGTKQTTAATFSGVGNIVGTSLSINDASGNPAFTVQNDGTASGSSFILNPSTKKFGFGTKNPLSVLHVNEESADPYRGFTLAQHNDSPAAAVINILRSHGSESAPTPLVQGDNIGALHTVPWDGNLSNPDYSPTSSFIFTVDGPVSPGLVPTAMTFWTGSNPTTRLEHMRITSAGNVGVGTKTPATPLHVVDTNGTNMTRGIVSAQHNDGPQAALVVMRKSRGTESSPSEVVQGDYTGNLVNESWDPAAFGGTGGYVRTAQIAFFTDGAPSRGSIPTAIKFQTGSTTSADTTSLIEGLRISHDGNVGVGGVDSPTQKLEVNGGVRLNTVIAQPVCNDKARGTFWVVQGPPDTVQVCLMMADSTYAWKTIPVQ
jgi:hypothetical protein